MNPLNVEVSYFKKCTDTKNPATVNLLTFLRSEKYRPQVEMVRAECDKAKRDTLKKTLLPGITPSGVFSERDEDHLVNHSGLIALDIDQDKNPYKPETIKAQIKKIVYVAYCGLSASGRGLWVLVPIANPDRHKEHYTAIRADFARFGIVLDPAPANPASFRFYSFDPNAYFNPAAVTYSRFPAPEPARQTSTWTSSDDGGDLARQAADYIIENKLTVAFCRNDYSRVIGICKREFGDDGEETAWAILNNSPNFLQSNTRRNFSKVFSGFVLDNTNSPAKGGTLVHWAKEHAQAHGGQFPPRVENNATQSQPAPVVNIPERDCSTPKPIPPALPTGYRIERYTARETGVSFDVTLNADGYPADWDSGKTQRERAALRKTNATYPGKLALASKCPDLFPGLESITSMN